MANADVDAGFKIFNTLLRARLYPIITAPTINICLDDIVAAEVSGVASAKLGYAIALYDAAVLGDTPGDEFLILGAVQAVFDHKMNPIMYMPATTVGDGTVAGYALVADHPDQQFVANMGEAAITAADMDLNYPIDGKALYAPQSTSTGLSAQFIKTTNAAVTKTIPIRLYRMAYPDKDSGAAVGARVICGITPACHYWASDVGI
jgi:hypothetical protein